MQDRILAVAVDSEREAGWSSGPWKVEALEKWLAYDADETGDGVGMMLAYADALEATKAALAKARGDA
jgi:hypothetical protein